MRISSQALYFAGLLLFCLSARADDKPPGHLSVMWRVSMPGYCVNNTSLKVSPDGRYVTFVRFIQEPGSATTPEEIRRAKLWKRKAQADPWFGQPEVILVGPGKGRFRRLGCGIRPEFVQGGRAIRFSEFVRPPAQMDLAGDYSRVVTVDLHTGRKSFGAERTGVPDRIEMPIDQPASRWYWPGWDGRASKPDYRAMRAVYVSEVGSAKRRRVTRLPAVCTVDEVYETKAGPLALMYLHDTPVPVGKIIRLAAPGKALYVCRRAARNDAFWCTVTPLPDGKLLLADTIQSFSPSPWKLSIRWSILDPVSGKVTPLAWKLPASETAGGYTFSVSRDGTMVAVGTDAPKVGGSYAFQHIGILSLEFHVDKLSRPLL